MGMEQTNGFQSFRNAEFIEEDGQEVMCSEIEGFRAGGRLNVLAERSRPAFAEAATRRQG
jgi:hypothetical protein